MKILTKFLEKGLGKNKIILNVGLLYFGVSNRKQRQIALKIYKDIKSLGSQAERGTAKSDVMVDCKNWKIV